MKVQDLQCLTDDENGAPLRFLNLWRMNFEHQGYNGMWNFASRRGSKGRDDKPLVDGGEEKADGVIIPARLELPGGDSRIVINKQFRYPLGDYEYDFPSGLFDADQTLEELVGAELKEETGLDLKTIDLVSPPLYSSAGMTDESVVIAYVTATGELSDKHREPGEDIETLLLTAKEVKNLIAREHPFEGVKIAKAAWPILVQMVMD